MWAGPINLPKFSFTIISSVSANVKATFSTNLLFLNLNLKTQFWSNEIKNPGYFIRNALFFFYIVKTKIFWSFLYTNSISCYLYKTDMIIFWPKKMLWSFNLLLPDCMIPVMPLSWRKSPLPVRWKDLISPW